MRVAGTGDVDAEPRKARPRGSETGDGAEVPRSWTEQSPVGRAEVPRSRTEQSLAGRAKSPDDQRMQTVLKKAIKAKWTRRKKRMEAKWNTLPGGTYVRGFLNLFFTVEILMLLMANVVVLEGYLQYGYFHFRAAGCKVILSADGIRIAAGAAAVAALLLGIFLFRKRMKSFWKYIVWTFVSLALFVNMGFWRSIQPSIEWNHASGMEYMHILMGPGETHRGSFWAELENEVLTIPRDINLVEIQEIEQEYGISWEDWNVTVMVETNAAPCEHFIYQGRHVEDGSRIEVLIPLSKLKCDYGLLIIDLDGTENKGANIIFGSRPAAWYQELFYKPDRMYEAANYERMFSLGSWEWIAKSDAVEISPFENAVWTVFIASPWVAAIGILLIGMTMVCYVWYQIHVRLVNKVCDDVDAGASKKMYLLLAVWLIGSFAGLSHIMKSGVDLLLEWIFKII